jgi:hypothetical protein
MNNRGLVVWTTVGAALASAYWGGLTALLAGGAIHGYAVDSTQLVFPILLTVLYAVRGFKVYNGDHASARSLTWLHAIGALVAFWQIGVTHDATIVALYGAKVAIHLVGGIPAFLLNKALSDAPRPPFIPPRV